MPVPLISALPTVPSYDNTNFESLAPAFLSFLKNTFQSEMNAAIAAINSYDYGAAVNISKVIGLTAGYIPYGAGMSALASSANFVFSSNRLDLTNPSGAQARLTHSSGNYTDFQTDGDGNLTIAPSGGSIIEAKRKLANDTRARKVDVYKSLGSVANDTMIDALTFSSEGGENVNAYNVYMGGRLTVIVSGVTGATDHANISKTYSISATQKKTAALVLEAVEISELSSAPASNTQTPTVTVSAKAGATGTEAILELKSTFASFTQQRITVYFEGQEASTTSSGHNRITVE